MKGGSKSGVSKISLGRLQYIRWIAAGPTQEEEEEEEASCLKKPK
jgi:hypothetical protein